MNDPLRESVAFVGPFQTSGYRPVVDGYRVPYIEASLKRGTEDEWAVLLDGRFELSASHEEAQRWLPFVANAMAIAAGYSCHGANCQPMNPFTVQMMGIELGDPGDDEEQQT